ncbi:MAG TPA: hypothetical protein VNO30_40580 [Kofleriaceae bacterium]|nr:hypothetical protein [Kofleriaceae bacterium]
MKQHVLLCTAALAAAAAAAGCEKSSDLVPVVAETKGIVESYQQRATELERRVNELVRRGLAINANPAEPASFLLTNSRADIEGMKATLRDAQGRIAKAAGDDKLDEPKRVAEVRLIQRQLSGQLDDSWVRANAKLDSVEAWLSRAESRPAAPPPPPAPAPAPTIAPGEPAPTGAPAATDATMAPAAGGTAAPAGQKIDATGAGPSPGQQSTSTGTGGAAPKR